MTRFMHPEFVKSMLCFGGAGIAYCGKFLANIAPPQLEMGIDSMSKLGVIGCLIYAIKYLNDERNRERESREKDREKWESKWNEEHEANIEARDKDRETREKLADAVEELTRTLKK